MLFGLISVSSPNPATFGARDQDIGENPPKSDRVDEMEDVSQTRVWDIPRTGIRHGRLMEIVKQKADKRVIGYLR